MYTASEVAKLFSVNTKTVKRWAVAGKLKATKTPGGHYRFEEQSVHKALESN